MPGNRNEPTPTDLFSNAAVQVSIRPAAKTPWERRLPRMGRVLSRHLAPVMD